MTTVKFQFLEGGYCLQYKKMAIKTGAFETVPFAALFGLIYHPIQGWILFDTGYSEYVVREYKHFPYQIFRLLAPLYFDETKSALYQLQQLGLTKNDIKLVILSHFHADHIGGIRDFPNAKFLYLRRGYETVRKLKPLGQIKAAFIPNLLPSDFDARSGFIEDAPVTFLPYEEFPKGYDLMGDGSIIAVELPGHAVGQIGLFLKTDEGKTLFLVADACWTSQAYRDDTMPHPIASFLFDDTEAYECTLHKLHDFHLKHPEIDMLPTHCQEVRDAWVKH